MKKVIGLILLYISILVNVNASVQKVLFIGNSYVYVNDLPNTLKNLALSMNDSIDVDSYCPGGYTAQSHWNDATTIAKIAQGNWDFIIIQCQSQEPSFSPTQVSNNTYPYVKKLDSFVKASNACAEVLYYMTWGRKNGDAANCTVYPPVCTYHGMQQRLRESYMLFAQDFASSVSPIGVVWQQVRTNYPNIELYQSDESHPSVFGTYLAASTFYSSIFHKSNTSNYLPTGVDAISAQQINTIANQLVLDSIETWQSNGNIPHALFSFNQNNNSINCTNNSLRYANVFWDFGDGQTSTTLNPTHTYTNLGTYTLSLKAISNCGKEDISTKSVVVNTLSLQDEIKKEHCKLYQNGTNLKIEFDSYFNNLVLELYSIEGKKIYTQVLSSTTTSLNLNYLSNAVYFLKIRNEEILFSNKTIFIGH